MKTLVVAITGASGAVYSRRLLEVLCTAGHRVRLTVSPAGAAVLKTELDLGTSPFAAEDTARELAAPWQEQIEIHSHTDLMAPIASGSCLTAGMIILPCSGGTLSAIAHGGSNNLIQRAAQVHLKERRKLILVPRETPLSLVHLENMKQAHLAGAVILPAMPGWYHGVRSLDDLVDFVVARVLDQLEIEHRLMQPWGSAPRELPQDPSS